MDSCWFVLLRHFLRVDNVLVRLRETRVFCALPGSLPGDGAPTVLREIRHCEATFAELQAANAPAARVSVQGVGTMLPGQGFYSLCNAISGDLADL